MARKSCVYSYISYPQIHPAALSLSAKLHKLYRGIDKTYKCQKSIFHNHIGFFFFYFFFFVSFFFEDTTLSLNSPHSVSCMVGTYIHKYYMGKSLFLYIDTARYSKYTHHRIKVKLLLTDEHDICVMVYFGKYTQHTYTSFFIPFNIGIFFGTVRLF